MRKQTLWILSALLFLQLALFALLTFRTPPLAQFHAEESLLAFDGTASSEIVLETGEGETLRLVKEAGLWQLPILENFPADSARIESFFKRLQGLRKGWAVATTGSAAERFSTSAERFERRITLRAEEQDQALLYLGGSPGYRKVYARADGEQPVYAVQFSSFEASVQASDWIAHNFLHQDVAAVNAIALPSLRLEKRDSVWVLADLQAQEKPRQEAIDKLVETFVKPSYSAVLLAAEAAKIEATAESLFRVETEAAGQEPLLYRYLKHDKKFYLHRSDHPYWFVVAEADVENLRKLGRADVVEEVIDEAATTGDSAPQSDGTTAEEGAVPPPAAP